MVYIQLDFLFFSFLESMSPNSYTQQSEKKLKVTHVDKKAEDSQVTHFTTRQVLALEDEVDLGTKHV